MPVRTLSLRELNRATLARQLLLRRRRLSVTNAVERTAALQAQWPPEITYTVGAPLTASVRARIAAIGEEEWRPASYREGSQVTSFQWQPKTWKRARRFVVRRDPLAQGEQLTLEGAEWHYWALVTMGCRPPVTSNGSSSATTAATRSTKPS